MTELLRSIPPLAIARLTLGAYLAWHYALLLPVAALTFGDEGLLPSASLNPGPSLSVLSLLHAPAAPFVLTLGGLLAALSYAAGLFTRTSGLALFFVAFTLWHRNQLTLNPSLPFLGFFFLAQLFSHRAPPWSLDRWWRIRRGRSVPDGADALPRDVLSVLWIVSSVAYSYSGWTKLLSPSWRSGAAVPLIATGALGRDGMAAAVLGGLPIVGTLATYTVLAVELSFLPLAMSRRVRPWLWTAVLALHVGLLFTLHIENISLGMIVVHLTLFDPRWLGAADGASPSPLFSRR
jgi:hypothetical protein